MNESLRQESEKLARSWSQHEAGWLRDYLVAGVEDPRINAQSILSRHFLVRALFGERFDALMQEEYRFAAAMNWLIPLSERAADDDELATVLYGLRRGADDVEGIQIPGWLLQIFSSLPARTGKSEIPNYIESFLLQAQHSQGQVKPGEEAVNTFCRTWRQELASLPESGLAEKIPVIEPACGSANDYRFLNAYGIDRSIEYAGFDLCDTNIENARKLYPGVRFEMGNVFEMAAADKSFELCVVHDLFEHLSLEGLEAAVAEVCRVTRQAICAGFFQMDEIPEHIVRPVDEYYWNLLSMRRMKEMFARHGFDAQVMHIGTFLRDTTGCDRTHNPNAYTLVMEWRADFSPQQPPTTI